LRIVIREGLLSPFTHKLMKWITSYVSAAYGIVPIGMDLEGSAFELNDDKCQKIAKDVRRRFRRHLKYIEVECI